MGKRWFLVLPILLAACSGGVNLKSVDYYHLFNDSNSKVWLVNKVIVDNAVISPSYKYDKDIFVFHENRNCDYIALKDITRKNPKKGDYVLDSEDRNIKIEFDNNQIWDLDLIYLTEDSILMEPTEQ